MSITWTEQTFKEYSYTESDGVYDAIVEQTGDGAWMWTALKFDGPASITVVEKRVGESGVLELALQDAEAWITTMRASDKARYDRLDNIRGDQADLMNSPWANNTHPDHKVFLLMYQHIEWLLKEFDPDWKKRDD